MQKNFFTKRKIITFYSKMEKHKIFEKIKIFYQTLSLIMFASMFDELKEESTSKKSQISRVLFCKKL